MKKILISIAILILIGIFAIPAAVNSLSPARIEKAGTQVRLYRHSTGKIINLSVDNYVIGAVAAEMPPDFPEEALKAQAVVARTYIMKRLAGGGVANPIHPGADVCDDPGHYQSWISRDEMKKKWGTLEFYQYYFKVALAVYSTGNEVIIYKGQLIDPAYFSSCGGEGTVSAGEVWKFDVPYLKGVSCPYDADPQPLRVATFTPGAIKKATGVDITELPVSTGRKYFFAVIEKDSGGQPKTVRIGNKIFSAVAVRDMLGLRSARFYMTMENGVVKVSTIGNGHGVGMCQYGAKGMALKGKNFLDILKHYYTGVEITDMKG